MQSKADAPKYNSGLESQSRNTLTAFTVTKNVTTTAQDLKAIIGEDVTYADLLIQNPAVNTASIFIGNTEAVSHDLADDARGFELVPGAVFPVGVTDNVKWFLKTELITVRVTITGAT